MTCVGRFRLDGKRGPVFCNHGLCNAKKNETTFVEIGAPGSLKHPCERARHREDRDGDHRAAVERDERPAGRRVRAGPGVPGPSPQGPRTQAQISRGSFSAAALA